MRYEPIAKPRFQIERAGVGEQIRVKARRRVWPMVFLPFWLTAWTAGGIGAIYALFQDFQPFLVLWLCFWAVAWVAVAGVLVWMFTGSETVRVVDSDVEIAHHALGMTRRWLYEGRRVRNLRLAEQPPWPFRTQFQVPFLNLYQSGAVKFDYGPRTVRALSGLDEAEGAMVVERLLAQLPAAK